jgi:hypothetical protein
MQRAWAAKEATTHLRVFEVAIVPGLLRTADYARHVSLPWPKWLVHNLRLR